ncbi:MAG: aldose 1-epimerase [Betaproteobacteria bacterium]
MTGLLTLSHGDAQIELAPATGGAIASFTWRGVPILRPTPHEVIEAGNVRRHACYPLVPYSNRIARGELTYAGRQHRLALNFGSHPHAIHGVGWQRSWQVLAHDATSALLAYDHVPADASLPEDPDRHAWPWPFRATQWFQLGPAADGAAAALRMRLALTNTGTQCFPFGMGWHPFFPRTVDTRLGFHADGVWETDATMLPIRRLAATGKFDFDPPCRVASRTLDNVFTGWTGAARLDYPDSGRAVTIRGDTASSFLVVYIPADDGFLAVEPVTHMTDAFNRAAQGEAHTGMRELRPGDAFSCTMEISVRALSEISR